jgi:glycosyltransferase involved in cell wall biosynthesis
MKTHKEPFISVLIPTHNYAQYIRRAVDSIFAQNYSNFEIIVVDDGSTDDTEAVLKDYPSNLKYFYKTNGGIASARNYCLEKASGEYLAWVDSDDYWLPEKLYTQVNYLEAHPDCQIVFTRYENFFENGVLKNSPKMQYEIDLAAVFKHYLPSALIKKEIFEICGNFKLIIGEDFEIVTRMMIHGIDINNCIDQIYYFRCLHGHNSIVTLDYQQKDMWSNMAKNLREKIVKNSCVVL